MTRDNEVALLELAASVSDGVPINWREVEAESTEERLRLLQSQMKAVSAIAELHRTTEATAPPSLRTWSGLQIRRKIGEGAYGQVYCAWDPSLLREVALKLVNRSGPGAEAAVKEARSLARVRHTNVVTVYGVGQEGDWVGLWMELIRGRTLEETLRDHGSLGGREAALIGIDLCRALAAVHGAKLVHGDVKSHNVMREEGGRILLMDFGLVRENPINETVRKAGGTPVYMAPELVEAGKATVQSDIFALGVLLYHLVTASYPFERSDKSTSRFAQRAKLLHDQRPDLHENLVQVIERALAPDPADRFTTAGEMLHALLASLGSQVAPPKQVHPGIKWGFKGRFAQFTAGAMVFAALIVLALVLLPKLPYSFAGLRTPFGATLQPSIAVLSLADLSSSPENDYLGESIAEELTNRLTRAKQLRVVVARSFELKRNEAPEWTRLANELQVATLLTGTVRKRGDKIRISVQLIDPRSNKYLWSETYEKPFTSLFTLEDDISRSVVGKLNVQLAGMQMDTPSKQYTASLEAYDLYLKGRFYWNKRTPEAMERAIKLFEQAVIADPKYALAYSGLADSYSTLVDHESMPARIGMPLAKSAALKARELDDSLAEAHTSLGFISSVYDWDWASAEQSFKRAIELNPSYPTAHSWYARFLTHIGDMNGAIEEAKRAAAIDPLSLPVNSALGCYLYYARRFDESQEQLQRTLDLDQSFSPAHFFLGRIFIRRGRFDSALIESEKSGVVSQLLAGEAYAFFGRRAEAMDIINKWQEQRLKGASVAPSIALVYASLGENSLALRWLNEAYEERDSSLLTARVHPAYDALKSDPRYIDLFKRMGLPYRRQ